MPIKSMNCPSCGHPLPENTRANELVNCPACNSTLYLSDWQIGDSKDAVAVATPTRVYKIADLLGKDDLCNTYRSLYKIEDKNRQGICRIARDPADNDLVHHEAQMLYHLQTIGTYEEFRHFLPMALESFLYQDGSLEKARQLNMMGLHESIHAPNELYTLEEIHDYYLNGIDPKDMAWMWRRLLYILGYLHKNDVVHGAITPSHVLIEPKDHKLVLTGWGFAVRDAKKTGDRLKAVSLSYEKWYPPEVFEKQPATPGLDILMAARCMLYLIGAEPLGEAKHRNLDAKTEQHLARCLNPNPRTRPQDAWQLLDEYDHIIEGLWGPRKFHVFKMPYKA